MAKLSKQVLKRQNISFQKEFSEGHYSYDDFIRTVDNFCFDNQLVPASLLIEGVLIDPGYGDYDETYGIRIWGSREENDEEYDTRIANLIREKEERASKRKDDKKKENEEYQTYLRLKEKFG